MTPEEVERLQALRIDRLDVRAKLQELDRERRKLLDADKEDAVLAFDELHEEEYDEAGVVSYDDEGQCECCVLTGLPIIEGDETVEDSEYRRGLVKAIPQWPEFSPEVEEDEDDED